MISDVQSIFLSILKERRIPSAIYLKNSIKLSGFIVDFDENIIMLSYNNIVQLIFKNAISTIVEVIMYDHWDGFSSNSENR